MQICKICYSELLSQVFLGCECDFDYYIEWTEFYGRLLLRVAGWGGVIAGVIQ